MQDFEKLGQFYLGKVVNPTTKKVTDKLLLYDSKNFTTHAVCLGMTGSGKTGLCINILEEGALDKIPAIIIDPKGDLGNLLLTFPKLSPENFEPWVDHAEAERKHMTTQNYAEEVATTWKEGLEKWGESPERIQRLRDTVDIKIYTPASNSGIPLSILNSFSAPPKELIQDSGAFRDRIMSITSSILGLLGISADPIKSREHILISSILEQSWSKGKDLDIATLIQQVQKPPFNKIGVMDIETFFPAKDRMALSISLNNLLASPGFQAWMQGEPLDIQSLIYSETGKPTLAILSIAHLSDAERMFFVTLLLNEFISWMRRQSGTTSLRCLLYMDEIFGYFPPIATPPSKKPMMTLLKQARAYGVGIVLATQNPVDLDYKGLANCGTWFIGKLQTERDRARVVEGLSAASNGEIDTRSLNNMLSSTGNRIFILRSIYEKDQILFETRWSMSYLRGPLTLTQIASLTEKTSQVTKKTNNIPQIDEKPLLPSGIQEYFATSPNVSLKTHYKPYIVGMAKLHFIDKKNNIDIWQDVSLAAPPIENGNNVNWEEGKNIQSMKTQLKKTPDLDSTFEALPEGLLLEKNYTTFEKSFATMLYQSQTYNIFKIPDLNITSKEGETETDFKNRINLTLREQRDENTKKVRDKYAKKTATLMEKIRQTEEKIANLKQKAHWGMFEAFTYFLSTIIGAFFGRGVTKGTITQTGTSMRRAGRIPKETQVVSQAEEDLKMLQLQLAELQDQMNTEILNATTINESNIETITVRPRKTDIDVTQVALLWV